jgi:molybdopterin synthase sulfur carrier subunit
MAGTVTLLYFAWLRERIGFGQEHYELMPGVDRVDRLIDALAARGGGYEAAFERRETIRCAVNQNFAGTETAIAPGDEVAFFPPVTGG